ncbi:hypothetical protein [Oceanobacillus saliphilus]|uniref:hypothetical protein n=1 Tax=Oceanobacillus saliphilus TaxID=2925834 RepID=UPI00201E16D1|nr:hypothetical protein [Oceanobacillus saliphilus]
MEILFGVIGLIITVISIYFVIKEARLFITYFRSKSKKDYNLVVLYGARSIFFGAIALCFLYFGLNSL